MEIADTALLFAGLTKSQRELVGEVTAQFRGPFEFSANPESDIVTASVLERLGDTLRLHHAYSRQALSKDRFEFALERALNLSGIKAELATSRTNRGHDLTVEEVRVSLKTEAAAGIKPELLHISKFMELGRGEWHLPTLRDLFLEHMGGYERIFQFRCLKCGPAEYFYELVEIPMSLLREARHAELEICENSRQTPKPGYGYVKDGRGRLKFALYFDGGTERKLQIKSIRKDLCKVHATWWFRSAPLV